VLGGDQGRPNRLLPTICVKCLFWTLDTSACSRPGGEISRGLAAMTERPDLATEAMPVALRIGIVTQGFCLRAEKEGAQALRIAPMPRRAPGAELRELALHDIVAQAWAFTVQSVLRAHQAWPGKSRHRDALPPCCARGVDESAGNHAPPLTTRPAHHGCGSRGPGRNVRAFDVGCLTFSAPGAAPKGVWLDRHTYPLQPCSGRCLACHASRSRLWRRRRPACLSVIAPFGARRQGTCAERYVEAALAGR